ncbi:response regulator receiver protein [Thioclava sp. SK-1]|uniref:response regulator n=1 Tax=Thioclava sp. SK-1 TaxID=1889770 RepID=UPI000824DDCB|nr:response regulator [Thioclava sp. SK-1]OCX60542.1 response regulator receiver protein [Thioclava sp. SK-1]
MSQIQVYDYAMTSEENSSVLRILSIDDDQLDRMRLRSICRKAGLSVEFTEAADLDEVRDRLKIQPYDLVFIDHHLGMHTGLDALRILQSHEEQLNAIPIMLTSAVEYKVAVEAMRRGCADYIVKDDLSVDSLIKSITSAIERRALYSALADARASEAELKDIFKRFMSGCGPEMREVLRRSMSSVRAVKTQARSDENVDVTLLSNLSLFERSAKDLVVFMDDLETVVGDSRRVTVNELRSRI